MVTATIEMPVFKEPVEKQKEDLIQNPALVFENVLNEIEFELYQMEQKCGNSHADIDNFIGSNEPKLKAQIDWVFASINNDIYARFKENSLTHDAFQDWLKDLLMWKKHTITAIHLYEMTQLRENVKSQLAAN